MTQTLAVRQMTALRSRNVTLMDEPTDRSLQSRTDEALIELSREGREDAFAVLVQRYQNRVFSLVHRVLHIPAETEDMAQDVFVTVYRTLEQFRGDCSFSTWVYRIALNLCKNRIKYLQRRNFHRAQDIEETSENAIQSPQPMAFANPEQQLLGRELERLLQHELSALEEDFRIVLVLRDLEHLSYEEIADITDLALGTVKSRIHRARSMLKSRMEPYLR